MPGLGDVSPLILNASLGMVSGGQTKPASSLLEMWSSCRTAERENENN